MRVERDFVADWPAEQLIDRLAKDLAANIPKSDVDRAHAFNGCTTAAHIGEAAEYLVPKVFDTRRILSFQCLTDLTENRAKCAIGELRRRCDLTPATHT